MATDQPVPEEISRALAAATRFETPCGDGSMVWHVWGEGAPTVLLHGGSGSWTHWLRNVEPLAASGRRVIVPDLPGFGASARPPVGRDADALPEPLEAGLQALAGDAACDLVGFSFGGMTAGIFAAQYPKRVRQLVVCGAPGLGLASRRSVPLLPWKHLEDEAQKDAIHRANLASLMLLRPESITGLALWVHKANVVRDRMRGRSLSFTDILARSLARVECPVHAIYGEEDVLYRGRMDELAAVFAGFVPFRGLTLIPEAGHWVQFEQAEAFNAALLAALGSN